MQPNDPIVGSSTLRRPAIQSPNFVAGVAGWAINADGSAEFTDLTISGGDTTVTVGPGAGSTGSISIKPVAGSTAGGAIIDFATGQAIESTPANIESEMVGGGQVLGLSLSSAGVVGGLNFPSNINLFSQGTGGQGSSIQFGVSNNGDTTEFAAIIDGASSTIQLNGSGTFAGAIKALENWQIPVLGANWATGPFGGGVTDQPIQYRHDAEDNLVIVGSVHTTSAAPAATIFTLGANWRPLKNQLIPIVTRGATVVVNAMHILTTGAVSLVTALAAANVDVYFQVCVPMGNIT